MVFVINISCVLILNEVKDLMANDRSRKEICGLKIQLRD